MNKREATHLATTDPWAFLPHQPYHTMSANQESPVPSIISMEVDDDNENESEYRLRIGNRVKYLKVAPATFDRATLSFPLAHLPPLPYEDDN